MERAKTPHKFRDHLFGMLLRYYPAVLLVVFSYLMGVVLANVFPISVYVFTQGDLI